MKILYLSDIHLEFQSPPELGEHGQVDLVVLAGDIGVLRKGPNPLQYAQDIANKFACPMVFVPGNHEYYGSDFDNAREAILESPYPDVEVLDRDSLHLKTDDGWLRVLGATLWTDYKVSQDRDIAMVRCGDALADHHVIRRARGTGRFLPEDALGEHERSRAWLLKKLREPFKGKTLVVTHHSPHSSARNKRYPLDHITAAFTSDCDDLMAAAADAKVIGWIYGHDHYCQSVEHNGVRLLTAQLGYPSEKTGWTGPGVLEI